MIKFLRDHSIDSLTDGEFSQLQKKIQEGIKKTLKPNERIVSWELVIETEERKLVKQNE